VQEGEYVKYIDYENDSVNLLFLDQTLGLHYPKYRMALSETHGGYYNVLLITVTITTFLIQKYTIHLYFSESSPS